MFAETTSGFTIACQEWNRGRLLCSPLLRLSDFSATMVGSCSQSFAAKQEKTQAGDDVPQEEVVSLRDVTWCSVFRKKTAGRSSLVCLSGEQRDIYVTQGQRDPRRNRYGKWVFNYYVPVRVLLVW